MTRTFDTDAATRAAFAQRYRFRPYTFDAQQPAVQDRWRVVTERVLAGEVKSGREFRDAYLDGIGAPDRDTDKQWTEIGPAERASWVAVFDAARAAGLAAAALEREAA